MNVYFTKWSCNGASAYKIGISKWGKDKLIEERFAGIEASVEYINKSIDNKDTEKDIVELKTSMATIKTEVKSLEGKVQELVDSSKNPLAQ